MPICAADTSPLIAFSAIGRLDVLQAVYDEIWVPRLVFEETVTQGDGWTDAAAAQRELRSGGWMLVKTARPTPLLPSLYRELGRTGEAEAICLASEHRIPVLMDDLRGRKVATRTGVKVIGSLGVLRLAKRQGAVPQAAPLIAAMAERGIRFKRDLISTFLAELGER